MTFDLPTVLGTPVESAARLCKADKAQILVPSENVHRFYSAASYGHTTIADQAAIAIENVRSFDAKQQRTRELAESLEDLQTAQDRHVQTQKLASLGQLTAGIAHEIKNPLNFVNNFSGVQSYSRR